MKKFLPYIIILIILAGLFSPVVGAQAQVDTDTKYELLAPLPGLDPTTDTATECAFGEYMNNIISLIIGLIAIGAVVMIVMGGLQYMTSELVSSKEAGKDRIRNALLGLVIALSAYVLLFTINEKLIDMCLDLPEVKITVMGPDAGDDTIDPDFARGIKIYTSAEASPGITDAVAKLEQGWEISQFHVFKNNRMLVGLKKGSETDNSTVIDISPGLLGYAPTGTGKQGDKKTPSGNWEIIEIRHILGEAQFNDKGSNMGAAFWRLDPMTSGERGIGMHGNKTGTLGATNGCIRLKNADILALQKYVKVGTPVFIDN